MTDRLRAAAEAALDALERARAYVYETDRPQVDDAMGALRTALAEPDYWQEEAQRYAANADYWRQRYESLAEQEVDDVLEQEPVAWVSDSPTRGNGKRLFWKRAEAWRWSSNLTPLYTAPPRREWVGLTGEERASIYDKYRRGEMVDSFEMMFAVEDKLKERNT